MSTVIKIKHGLKTNLPTLAAGEQAYTTDTNELFIGTSTGNKTLVGADSGWFEPTLLNSMTTSGFKYKKIGNTVMIQGDLTNPNATGFQTPFSLPAGYRPLFNIWFPCSDDGAAVGTTNARITASNGDFNIYMTQNHKAYINIRFEVA